jgi:hypothetical protein
MREATALKIRAPTTAHARPYRHRSCAYAQVIRPIDLPPKLQHVADLLGEQPPDVCELFRCALAQAMIDDEKAWGTIKRIDHGLTFHLLVRKNDLRHHAQRRQVSSQT